MTSKEQSTLTLQAPSERHSPFPTVKGRSAWPQAILLFVLALVMNVPYLGMTPLAGTEGHRAITAHQMVQSGQWLVPRLFGRPYLAKPPLHYWIIATAETAARAVAHGGQRPMHDRLVAGIVAALGRPNEFVWRMPSAIEGGALCAVVCLFSARWFGRPAGLVAGACALGMIALWGERQVTDIDVTDTLCATITALCGIELLFGRASPLLLSRPRTGSPANGRDWGTSTTNLHEPVSEHHRQSDALWRWILGAGLGLGGTLMTKGPAGLPIIVGVWGWAAYEAFRSRQLSRLASSAFWAPLFIGVAPFATYALAAHWFIRHRGLPLDNSGVVEGLYSLFPNSLRQVGNALILPGLLMLFSFPVSMSLPLWLAGADIRAAMDERERRRSRALTAAVLIAWAIGLLAGMMNPRYAYPTLPLLCPLAGAVAVTAATMGGKTADWVRGIAGVSAIAMAGAAVFLAKSAWNLSHAQPILLAAVAGLAVVVALIAVLRSSQSWSAAAWLIPLIVLASVPFGIRQSLARAPISGLRTAQYINQVAGPHPPIVQGMALTYRPETFYYAQARATAVIPNAFDPRYIKPGTWLYMDKHERDRWKREVGEQLNHIMLINLGGKNEPDFYFAWYGPKDDPAARLADNAPPIAPTAQGRK